MRITHVTDVFLPRLGGIELQVDDLSSRQLHSGHQPTVLTTTAPGADTADAVPVRRLGHGTAGIGPYRVVREPLLLRALRADRPDVVHAHISAFSPLAWTLTRLAAADGIPTVVTVHSMWHDIVPLVRRYARRYGAAAWPVTWTAVSTAAAAAVQDALDGAPVAVLPNGIDPAAWLTPPAPRTGAAPTLISVLRMVRRKRPAALLDLLLVMRTVRPGGFRAVLVGDGPLLPGLRRRVAAAGAEADIVLAGALDRPAIRALLAAADLYVAPARHESFGIAALEARSAGLPVVARAGSGIADFIRDGTEGWLVHSDDDLRGTVESLLDDPARLTAVARHNRAVAPGVSWGTVLAAADALYDTAAHRQCRRPVHGRGQFVSPRNPSTSYTS
ncbi:glycosyltransferase family 4 protein [Dactylosporangium sp. NPDC006015]|uniref:glycosyltransferase family 4 protein n=1 Tax=Dactylosporangium sp. NPDC006015 TaxID=3154576 RepID=UPI0033A5E16B